MPRVSLPDIRLHELTLERLPRLASLRSQLVAMRPEVCIERAREVTRFMSKMADPKEPIEVTYARAVSHFLSCKAPLFFDENLIAGTTTSKCLGAPVYPELTGLTIWPELDTIATRKKNPLGLSRAEADELDLEIFPYWMDRNVLEVARRQLNDLTGMSLFQRFVFFLAGKAGAMSHTVPCYSIALNKGLEVLIAEAAERERALHSSREDENATAEKLAFYQAAQIALRGVIEYAKRLAQEARRLAADERNGERRRNLLDMASACEQVPAKPARSFREALSALWILQVGIHAESINMAMSPGRLDQILYPWYRTDIEEGRITVAEALEQVGCFWLKLNDNANLVPETAEELFGGAGTVPAVTLGGVDANGDDAVNDLTYVMLRATELLRTRDPNVNARYHYGKNTRAYRNRVVEVLAETRAVPAFHNDVADIRTLENQGVTAAHARDYAVIGCVELGCSGRSYDASSSIILNLASALELALYDGKRPITGDEQIGLETGDPSTFVSFEQFWEAFKAQLGWIIEQAIGLNEALGRAHQERLPTPLLSSLFEGPFEKGQDLIRGGALYNSSGATHVALADTIDSLNAIESAVFLEKRCTFAELLEALRADFGGQVKLQSTLAHRMPKYGTSHPMAVKNARNLIRFLYETYQRHVNYRGGRYRPAYWTMTNHAGQGKMTGALPNGRRAHRPFASGITPVSESAPDLAACLHAVGQLDPLCIPGGEALNLKIPSIQGPEDVDRFGDMVESYFRMGGLHVQFNVMSYEMLLDARDHPESYPELLVRVSGYSAYFNDLNDVMKQEIITRTAYDLQTGHVEPFPTSSRSLLPFE